MDNKIEIIYKKFQSELKLNKETIEYAQRLHEDLSGKSPFKYESPYLMIAICIFTVSRIADTPKTLYEISKISHIKEEDLRKCYEMVFDEIKVSLKRL